MQTPRRPCLALTLAAFLLTSPCFGKAVVSGRVVDREGNPIVKSKVVIGPFEAGLRNYPVNTNKKGEFFASVLNGAYSVKIESGDWVLDTASVVIQSRRNGVPGVPDAGGRLRTIHEWSGRFLPGEAPPRISVGSEDRATVDLVVVDQETLRKEQIDTLLSNTARALKSGDRAGALGAVEDLLETSPDDVLGLTLRAYIHLEDGELEQAEADLLRALQGDPAMYDARYQLALVFQRTGRTDEALEAYRRAATDGDTGDKKAKAFISIGELERDTGETARAIEAFEQAVAADPELESALAPELANLYTLSGDTERAKHWLRGTEEQGHADPALEYNLCVAHFNSREWEPAVECFRELLSRQPDNAEAHKNVAMALLNLGQQAECVDHLRKYLELSPDAEDAEQIRAIADSLSS